MALLHFDNVVVAALAGVLPDHVQKIDTDPAHPRATYIANFVKQTGIKQRHISITEQTSTDLGYAALLLAVEKVPTTVERLGNTNGASVSLTMVDAYADMKSSSISY